MKRKTQKPATTTPPHPHPPRPPRQITSATPTADELVEMLTVEDAAKLLNVVPARLYVEARKGAASLFPYVKVGRYIRFRRSSLLAWLARQEQGGGAA